MRRIVPLLLVMVACQGTIEDIQYKDSIDFSPRANIGAVDPESCEIPDEPETSEIGPLRLLTQDEFESTVAMIVGERLEIRDLLLPDGTLAGESLFLGNRGRVLGDQDIASLRLVAEHVAEYIVDHKDQFLSCGTGDLACVEEAISKLVLLAFRRPITDNELTSLMSLYDLADNQDEGLGLVSTTIFQSPSFVYHVEVSTDGELLTQYELASRLSFAITGRGPDEALLQMAEDSGLDNDDALADVARTLFRSEAGQRHTINQLTRWIGVENMRAKVPDAFPGLQVDAAAMAMLRESLRGFLKEQVYDKSAGIGEWFVNTPSVDTDVEAFYAKDDEGTPRAGLLTHPAWLASFSGGDGNLPTSRGKFVATDLLCLDIHLPTDPDFEIPPVMDDDGMMTTRERFEQHGDMPCATACHNVMDPLGYAFENFDAVGSYQTEEYGKPIDPTGEIDVLDVQGSFTNAKELSSMLAESDAIKRCFSKRWLEQLLSRLAQADEGCSIAKLSQPALDEGANLEDLTVAIVTAEQFKTRTPNREGQGSCRCTGEECQ